MFARGVSQETGQIISGRIQLRWESWRAFLAVITAPKAACLSRFASALHAWSWASYARITPKFGGASTRWSAQRKKPLRG
jgi:hypothetical protein